MGNFSENGIQFTVGNAGIYTGGMKIARLAYQKDGNGNIQGGQKVINAIDIDWNNAELSGLDTPINSTSQLLSILNKICLGEIGGSSLNPDNLINYATKEYVNNKISEVPGCDCPKFITIDAEDYEALDQYEQDAIYFVIGDVTIPDEEDEPEFVPSDITTNLYVNGNPIIGSELINLNYGNTYILSGTLRGKIVIEIPENTEPDDYTTVILNGVTIVSDDNFAIEYKTPEGAQNQKGLNVIIEKNTFNRIVCLKTEENTDDQPGAIYSMNNLNIYGAGYLSIQNKGGHGIRGKETTLSNLHLWNDTTHDGVHGKNISIIGGTYYFEKCNDAFGTADNNNPESGHILYYDGELRYHTLNGQLLDSKKIGIYFNGGLLNEQDLLKCTNMNLLTQESFNLYVGNAANDTGNIIAYANKEDYKTLSSDGTILNLQEITETITYGEGVSAITMEAYVIRYPYIQINGYLDKPIYFSPQIFGTNNASVKLNGAYLTHDAHLHTMLYPAETGNVHIFSVQDTLNIIENTYVDGNKIQLECDAVKSDNNIEIESKNNSTLFITSVSTDGIDGGEVRITDSKGTIIVSGCGQRGIKGNAIVIGPNAKILKSSITGYYTTPSDTTHYTTFDGLIYVKNNCQVCHACNLTGSTDSERNESGFADIFGRNGKSGSKGVFGTTNNELKGYLITGSIGAILRLDLGNANNLYYNETYTSENHTTVIANDPGPANESEFSYNLNHQKHE